jgi:hypothetical protein
MGVDVKLRDFGELLSGLTGGVFPGLSHGERGPCARQRFAGGNWKLEIQIHLRAFIAAPEASA